MRQVGRLNETSTWPLLAKSANGYVSSFGELTNLRLARSPKRLELVTCLVGDVKTRREFANQSALGLMTTATHRRLDDPTRFLPERAYTGGVDWDWRLSPRYAVQGFWAGSSVRGDASAIDALQRSTVHSLHRPDSRTLDYDPSRTSFDGTADLS